MYGIRKQNFIDYVDNKRFSHAYIFEVDNYEEDYSFILDFVKVLFCEDKSFSQVNCDKCNICNLIDEGVYPDLYIVRPDGNEIKKEQLINLELEFSNTSILSKNKVYIILEAEKMNKYSSNAILKFVEEPRDNVYGILVTKNKYKLLPTIISRCLYFNIREDQKYVFEDNYYEDFLSYLVNPDNLFVNYDSITEYFYEKEKEENEESSRRSFNKKKIMGFFNNLNLYMLDYYNGNVEDKCLSMINKDKIIEYISIIESCLSDLEFNLNYKLWFDNLFCRLIGGNYD
ncbi:MAG: hypothetical protein IJI43_02215 [Bacilli bacterium]|nr:hypothetical protein [Bacilli bacterium]MBQ6538652.1 hypothetical protein [Bacilli bacterium]